MNQNQKWQSNLYDTDHNFVSKYGKSLVTLLAPKENEMILDLGCGTGDLSKQILDFGAHVKGIDESKEMISEAKSKYPDIDFELADALNMPFSNQFDAVFSNAVLHWITSPERLLERVYESLKDNGRFVAEFGGKNNCTKITSEIITVIREYGYSYEMRDFPWYFPSIGEYTSLMESVGFEVSYALYFERPTKLKNGKDGLKSWIAMFGDKLFVGIPDDDKERIVSEVAKRLENTLLVDTEWFADYKRIRIVGNKKNGDNE